MIYYALSIENDRMDSTVAKLSYRNTYVVQCSVTPAFTELQSPHVKQLVMLVMAI